MASTRPLFSLMLLFFAASLYLSLSHHSTVAAFDFHQWCQKTTHTHACIAIIEADPRGNLKTNINGLCTIINDKAKAMANLTSSKIAILRKSPSTSPVVKKGLRFCASSYETVIDKLTSEDFSVLNHETYPVLVTGLETVNSEASDCENILKELPKPISSPLTAEDRLLQQIVEIVIQILNLNECKKITDCE